MTPPEKKKPKPVIKSKKKAAAKRKPKTAEKIPQVPQEPKKETVKERPAYLYAVGRRKTSIARVRYIPTQGGELVINNKPLQVYFPSRVLQMIVQSPVTQLGATLKGSIAVRVTGGGKRSQAESIRLGVSRVLIQIDNGFRPALKKVGFLTRDSRMKERKKYGLRRARRAPQWQKR